MNKIFTLLLVGALTAGAVTANAESQIFKKKKKKAKAETEQPAAKDSTKSSMTEYKKLLKNYLLLSVESLKYIAQTDNFKEIIVQAKEVE